MGTTPGHQASTSRSDRRRWLVVGLVALVVIGLIVAAAGWYYFYGQPQPAVPTIDNALQQLLPTSAPE